MCTAVRLYSQSGAPYLFRTCDLDTHVPAALVSVPAGERLSFSHGNIFVQYAFFGMSFGEKMTRLLDGINSAGLAGGLLMFKEGTSLSEHPRGIVGLELVAAMLAECKTIAEVCKKANEIRVLDVPHNGEAVPATMHYFFTDAQGRSIVLEAANPQKRGQLQWYASVGVLTNSPEYPAQCDNLRWFLAHSPELRKKSLSIDGICPDKNAPHLCRNDTFPAAYASPDRFVRAAVLKALNDRRFSDDEMLVSGYNMMHALFEPHTDGVFHDSGKDSFTQYIIIYDICKKAVYVRPHDALVWSSLALSELPHYPCRFAVCRDAQRGIFPAVPQR